MLSEGSSVNGSSTLPLYKGKCQDFMVGHSGTLHWVVYLVLGVPGFGGVPGPRGCTWSGGYLVLGDTWSQECVPGPGGTWFREEFTWYWWVYLVQGIYLRRYSPL